MPTSSPASTTGTAPMARVTRTLATSLSGMPGGTVTTGLDMISLTRTLPPCLATASLTRGPGCS